MRKYFFIFLFLFLSSSAYAKNIYVPRDYKTIQLAIDAAADYDVILLAEGTYTGSGNLGIRIDNKDIKIKSENGDMTKCVLDGEYKKSGIFVYKNKKNVTIEGITIANCYGGYGGAVSIDDSYYVYIKNCIIRRCRSSMSGGGIYAINTLSLNIEKCFFLNNETSVTGCGEVDGGGVATFSSNVNIVNCVFYQNKAKTYGGGIYFGGSYNLNIFNCDFVQNSASYASVSEGGGLYFTHKKTKITNTIIRENLSGANGTSEIGPSYWIYGAETNYSNIKGMDTGYGQGNMDKDPLFTSLSSGDLRLKETSPCIDTGTSIGAPSTDILGRSRPCGRGFDMGAYEYCGGSTTGSLVVTISPAEAVTAGAKWRVDGGGWQGSGTVMSLAPGSHTVDFSDVGGWTKPASQAVAIVAGQTLSMNGAYTSAQNQGYLIVAISPAEAVTAGAKWRVDGGSWMTNGTKANLSAGQHTVDFSDVSGWTKPASQTVAIVAGQTLSVNGVYTSAQNQGYLMVTISPAEAVRAGAKWRVDNGSWMTNGTKANLSAGQHRVDFLDIGEWSTPASQNVTILAGQTTTLKASYGQGYTCYLPYFSSDNQTWSGLALSNFGVQEDNSYTVEYFMADGRRLGTQNATIPPHGQRSFVADYDGMGWIRVRSAKPLTGLALTGDAGNYLLDLPFTPEKGTVFSAPHVTTSDGWDTWLYLCNTENATAMVDVEYFKPSGEFGQKAVVAIAANGSAVQSLLRALGVMNGGSLYIRSDRSVVGVVVFRNAHSAAGFPLTVME